MGDNTSKGNSTGGTTSQTTEIPSAPIRVDTISESTLTKGLDSDINTEKKG